MANALKINNAIEISGSTRSLDWVRSTCEYLLNRDNSWAETQLFYSQNGTSSNFTLSDSINNYDTLEITCRTNDGTQYTWSQRVNRLNKSVLQVNLETTYPSGTMYYKSAHVIFSGTSVSFATNYQYWPGGSVTSGSYVLIQEVKGIKYNYSNLPTSDAIQTLINLLQTTPGSIYNYSTSEQVVGTWTNGKTLYRKVVTGTKPLNDTDLIINSNIGVTPTTFNVDNSRSYILNDVSGTKYWLPANFYGGSTDWIRTFGNPSCDVLVSCGSAYSNYVLHCYIVILYTKD